MVKHIVLFKLKDEVPETDKLVVMNKFKEAIEALPADRKSTRLNSSHCILHCIVNLTTWMM